MARRSRIYRPTPPSYAQLEKRLVLLAWLHHRFGFDTNEELLTEGKAVEEGFDADGRSALCIRLATRQHAKVKRADLYRYDDNVRRHLAAMNAGRALPITLRYFQHLAALFAEHYLDWYFRPDKLLRALNAFVQRLQTPSSSRGIPYDTEFALEDLRKLAFWMATGSGKTLLMHLNYRQFLHYQRRAGNAPTDALDNILLITPNEGLSEQHLAELATSGIPAKRFNLADSGLGQTPNTVRVIEITKLVEQKRGGGVSVPVEAFEGNNLIFVDEGHKGSGGEVWRRYRDALAKTGFTFEYSATFGQALTASGNEELVGEYAKAIAFDYSYRYFHGDGFGKGFNILNLQDEGTEAGEAESTDLLLCGSLLAFYQQKRVFASYREEFAPYNVESPLWVFVGGTVNAVYSRNKQRQSDVFTVVRFLHRVLRNQGGWAVAAIGRILAGESGLKRPNGEDVFAGKFDYLASLDFTPADIYQNILAQVLHAQGSDSLQLGFVRDRSGEIGMKASASRQYFGVVYIGDPSRFRNLILERAPEIGLQEEAMAKSLFDTIARPDTTIEVLVGARKFMEGWNSWRVANMGLLNVGKNEGAQIIQLFGRGVRLRGKGMSLKRSAAQPGKHPKHLDYLETLNIFGVRADYMAQFKSYLEREDVHTDGSEAFRVPLQLNTEFLGKRLMVPRLPANRAFAEEEDIALAPLPGVRAQLDTTLKVTTFASAKWDVEGRQAQAGRTQPIPAASLDLVDWHRVHLALLEYGASRGHPNLAIAPESGRRIFEAADPACYELIADDALVAPRSPADLARLTEAVIALVKKYLDKLYRTRQERWESQHLRYAEVRETDANFQDYAVTVPTGDDRVLDDVRRVMENLQRLYSQDIAELPNIHFDRHLYQPLLMEPDSPFGHRRHHQRYPRVAGITTNPPQLNDGEINFVDDLRRFCRRDRQQKHGVLAGRELFLLRNLGRGKGVGFFQGRGFYPDFILWLKQGSRQRIVFVEPHGMVHARSYAHDDKAKLHEELRAMSAKLAGALPGQDISLDSYIISATPFETLRERYDDGSWDRDRFAAAHILFPGPGDEYDYLRPIVAP